MESYLITDQDQRRLEAAKELAGGDGRSLATLIEMLTDPSWVVRRTVVDSLALIGDAATEALCEVLRTRRDNEARIAAAVDALVLVQGNPERALTELASDTDPAVVADALQVIGRRHMSSAVPLLIKLTKDQNDVVAVCAIEALGRIGGRAAVEALIETIGSGNFFRTFPAIDILGRCGDRRVIEPLTALLKNANYLPEAVRALGRSGEKAAIVPLVDLLRSPIDSVARLAILALWDLYERFEDKSGGDSQLVDDFLRAQVDSNTINRLANIMSGLDSAEVIAACNLFGAIRKQELAPLLTKRLDDLPEVAASAAAALRKIGVKSENHVLQAIQTGDSARRKILLPIIASSTSTAELVACLGDEDPEVRALACDTVARVGNVDVVPNVFKLLEDENLRVVHSATAALQALGSRQARELAVAYSNSEKPSVRRAAIRILAYFGDAMSVAPILKALNDVDPRVREVAIQGLPYLEDPVAVTALYHATKQIDARTRALAVRAMAHLPKSDELTYSILLRSLADTDAWVRYYACQTIGRLGYSAASIEVAGLLKDEAGQVRVSAVEALSHLESRESHRALQQAAQAADQDVKRAALLGLGIRHRPEDLSIVMNALDTEDVSTRLIALSSVVNFNSHLVFGALQKMAMDTDDQICSAAIGFLAARSEVEATDVLIELLKTERTFERSKAALIIPQVHRASGLLVALESASDELAPVLVSVLLRSQRADSKRALMAALKLNNIAARKAAAAGIATSRDPERIVALRDAADNDPDIGVRNICKLLLSE